MKKNKDHKNDNYNLSTKMAVILGSCKIVIGISILFACIMLLVLHIRMDYTFPIPFILQLY